MSVFCTHKKVEGRKRAVSHHHQSDGIWDFHIGRPQKYGRHGLIVEIVSKSTHLNDDEHVVDANTQQQERDDRMDGSVGDAQVETETVRSQNGLSDH